jgi:hypothetical protein
MIDSASFKFHFSVVPSVAIHQYRSLCHFFVVCNHGQSWTVRSVGQPRGKSPFERFNPHSELLVLRHPVLVPTCAQSFQSRFLFQMGGNALLQRLECLFDESNVGKRRTFGFGRIRHRQRSQVVRQSLSLITTTAIDLNDCEA